MKAFTIYIYKERKIVPKEVAGREVEVSPFMRTFIHRSEQTRITDEGRNWVVSEITTGHSIASERTQKETIEKAKALLKGKTRDEIETAINKAKATLPSPHTASMRG